MRTINHEEFRAERLAQLYRSALSEMMGESDGPDCHSHLFNRQNDDPALTDEDGKKVGGHQLTAYITTFATVLENGAAIITRRGRQTVEVDLNQSGSPELTEAVNLLFATERLVADWDEEKNRLAEKAGNLRNFIALEPELIQAQIKGLFPKGTAGKRVDIAASGENGAYLLEINGEKEQVVSPEIGLSIAERKNALTIARKDLKAVTERLAELGAQLNDGQKNLALYEQNVRRLVVLHSADLRKNLGGELTDFKRNDRGQIVALVLRQVNENLKELPDDLRRRLITQHLTGEQPINEKAQKALGLTAAVQAIEKILAPPELTAAKPVPELAAKAAEPVAANPPSEDVDGVDGLRPAAVAAAAPKATPVATEDPSVVACPQLELSGSKG